MYVWPLQLAGQPQRHCFRFARCILAEHRRSGHFPLSILPLDNLQQTHTGQPRLILDGRGYDVPVRFRIVSCTFHSKVFAIFMNEVSLVPVHGLERIGTAFLFALFGQLDEFGQFVVDFLAEVRVFLCPLLHEVRVLRG